MAGFKRIWHLCMRLEVAALLMLLLLALTALASFFPQFPQAALADPERLARWEAGLTARYGAFARLLDGLGVFNPSRSPVFLSLLGLLVLTTVLCTIGRWRSVWRRALSARRTDSAPSGAPYSCCLPLPLADWPQEEHLIHVVQGLRDVLAQRGFRVQVSAGEEHSFSTGREATTDWGAMTGWKARPTMLLHGERNRLAGLATLVTHLAVPFLALGLVLSYGFGWREEVTVAAGETVAIRHKGGLALRQEGFAISRYPDGSAAGYEARVSVVENGTAVIKGTVRLNEPLPFRSTNIYLSGYASSGEGYRVTFLVVYDPGYGLVIVAGLLLLAGLTISLNFPFAEVQVQVRAEEILLTGRCGRQAWGFGREFTALVGEVQQRMSGWGRE